MCSVQRNTRTRKPIHTSRRPTSFSMLTVTPCFLTFLILRTLSCSLESEVDGPTPGLPTLRAAYRSRRSVFKPRSGFWLVPFPSAATHAVKLCDLAQRHVDSASMLRPTSLPRPAGCYRTNLGPGRPEFAPTPRSSLHRLARRTTVRDRLLQSGNVRIDLSVTNGRKNRTDL